MTITYYTHISSTLEKFLATFDIKRSEKISEVDCISNVLELNKLQFQLKVFYSKKDSVHIHFSLVFLSPNIKKYPGSIYRLIVMDYNVLQNSKSFLCGSNWTHKAMEPASNLNLGPLNSSILGIYDSIYVIVNFKLIKEFDCSSVLCFSLEPPSKAALFCLLNQKEASNRTLRLKSSNKEIWTNNILLSKECPYFEKRLKEEWCKASEVNSDLPCPIEFSTWSDEVLIVIVLHLYTGWLPGTPICEEVFNRLGIEKNQFNLDYNCLLEVHEVAEMLELHILSYFAVFEAQSIFKRKSDSLLQKITKTIIAP